MQTESKKTSPQQEPAHLGHKMQASASALSIVIIIIIICLLHFPLEQTTILVFCFTLFNNFSIGSWISKSMWIWAQSDQEFVTSLPVLGLHFQSYSNLFSRIDELFHKARFSHTWLWSSCPSNTYINLINHMVNLFHMW